MAVLLLLFVLLCFALPTFVVLCVGLAPTIVAYIVDDRRNPYRLQTITTCNLAGVLPYLGQLWSRGGEMAHALEILSNVYAWATMYMGAAVGLALLWLGPHLAVFVFNQRLGRERRSLETLRRALVEEWGPDVLPEPARRASAMTENTGGETQKTAPSGEGAVMRD